MYKRLDKEIPIVPHKGIFRRKLTLFQAVTLITSATIGAGVLGIPYAVAKVGIWVGLAYIIGLGLLMIGLNLLIGETAVRTKEKMQVVGLARKYLGKSGEMIMSVITYVMLFGVLVVYTIGEGEALSALFGGSSFNWSLIFVVVAGFLIFVGMRTIKTVEFFLSLGILLVVLLIVGISAPHLEASNFSYHNLAYLLFPYGVVLFAFHGTTSIPEAHSLLKDNKKDFKKAIIIAGIIAIVTYCLFAIIIVGVTGIGTSEIATIALGSKVGRSIFLFGNIFAVLAMGTGFLMNGLALKDSMRWDYKIPGPVATVLIMVVPLVIFILGVREFVAAIDIVGGVIVSVEMLIMLLIYWRAKQKGDLEPGKYSLHHVALLGVLLLIALSVGAVYSVIKLF